MKKKIWCLFPILAMILFVLAPYRTSNLYIRIYFGEVEGDTCTLYYATDTMNVFCIEQHESADIDPDQKLVTFCLDASLEGHITGLRLDFPNQEQLLSIRNITVSSGGVIRRQYDPCDFFAEENILSTHNILALDLAPAKTRTYILTSPVESYLVLDERFCQQITGYYSHYRMTRLAICAFFSVAFYIGKKKLFSADPLPETNSYSAASCPE